MERGTTSSNNEVVPPLNLLLTLKEESGEDLFSLPVEELRAKVLTGIILRDKENTEKQFYWMDEKSNLNCFMLLPKSLSIRADSSQVPRYILEEEKLLTKRGITLPQVKYERVGQLKVGGKFCTMGLSGRTEYEVVVFLHMKPTRGRIYAGTIKKLFLPDGSKIGKPWELVRDIEAEKWYPFQIGTFRMNPNNIGELSFDFQIAFLGLPDIIIKGVAIKPTSAN